MEDEIKKALQSDGDLREFLLRHWESASDQALAFTLFTTVPTIRYWRKKYGLKRNDARGVPRYIVDGSNGVIVDRLKAGHVKRVGSWYEYNDSFSDGTMCGII